MKGGKTDGKKDKTERKKDRQTDRQTEREIWEIHGRVIECNRRSGRYYRNSLDLIIHNKVNPISQVSDPERNPSGSVWILILWNQVTAVCLERFRLRSAQYLIKFCPVAAHCISSSSSSSSFSFISFFLLNLPAAGIKKQKPKKNCWSDQAATAAAAAASNVNQFLLLDSFLDFIGFCLPVSVPFLSIVFLCFYLIWFWFFFWTRSMSWLFFFPQTVLWLFCFNLWSFHSEQQVSAIFSPCVRVWEEGGGGEGEGSRHSRPVSTSIWLEEETWRAQSDRPPHPPSPPSEIELIMQDVIDY